LPHEPEHDLKAEAAALRMSARRRIPRAGRADYVRRAESRRTGLGLIIAGLLWLVWSVLDNSPSFWLVVGVAVILVGFVILAFGRFRR